MANAKDKRRMMTQRQQREAAFSCHPRELARSIARAVNRKNNRTENDVKGFRSVIEQLPKIGKRFKHPRHLRAKKTA